MKTVLTILTCVLSVLPIYAQWEKIEARSNSSYIEINNLFFLSDKVGFSYSGSSILKTTDGGEHWTEHPTMFTYSWFNDIHFPTENIGYACGGTAFGSYRNVIAKTIDGGETWDSLRANVGQGYEYRKIHFLNADEGFVSPQSNKLLKTVDGGENFEEMEVSNIGASHLYINEIISTADKTCFIATNEKLSDLPKWVNYIKKSTDMGNTWNVVYTDTVTNESIVYKRQINNMFFVNNTVGYAVGANGLFLKTTDGGESWDKQQIAPYTHLSSVYFTDAQVGYINNAGSIYKTTDGGESWNAQNITPLAIIKGNIQFTNDTLGYAIGETGGNYKIYKTTNAGENQLNTTTLKSSSIKVYPNPAEEKVRVKTVGISIKNISLYTLEGKKLELSYTQENEQYSFDVGHLASGTYLLQLQNQAGEKITKKLVVE